MRQSVLLVASVIILALVSAWWIYDSSSVSCMLKKASSCESAEKADEAMEILQQVISREPENIVAHINLGAMYFRKVKFESLFSENQFYIDKMLDEHELILVYVVAKEDEASSNLCDIAYSNTRELVLWFESGRKQSLLSVDHIAGLEVQMSRATQIINDYEEVFGEFRNLYDRSRGEVDSVVSNMTEAAQQLNDTKDQ